MGWLYNQLVDCENVNEVKYSGKVKISFLRVLTLNQTTTSNPNQFTTSHYQNAKTWNLVCNNYIDHHHIIIHDLNQGNCT